MRREDACHYTLRPQEVAGATKTVTNPVRRNTATAAAADAGLLVHLLRRRVPNPVSRPPSAIVGTEAVAKMGWTRR